MKEAKLQKEDLTSLVNDLSRQVAVRPPNPPSPRILSFALSTNRARASSWDFQARSGGGQVLVSMRGCLERRGSRCMEDSFGPGARGGLSGSREPRWCLPESSVRGRGLGRGGGGRGLEGIAEVLCITSVLVVMFP